MEIVGNREEAGSAFPYGSTMKGSWTSTSRWLESVAIGGGCEQHTPETWVKIDAPSDVFRKLGKAR